MSDKVLIHVPSSSVQSQGHHTALHRAAMVGNTDVIAALVQGGCAMDLQDRDGNTALHEVAWHGFCQCVKLLVKAGADIHVRNKAGNTALHLACQNAHAQSSRVLLLGGSRPDSKNNVGDTCLHVAARYNHLAIVKTLLGALCSVTEKNQVGDTVLHVAATLNHKKTVRLLLEAGTDGNAKNNAGKTALDRARDNNHRDVALLLARAPQVHRFTRGRTVRKRRERLKAERRTQSVTRVEILPNKESSSVAEDTPSSDQMVSRTPITKTGLHQHRHHHKTQAATTSPNSRRHHRRKLGELALDEVSPRRRENGHSEFYRKNQLFSYDGEVPFPQKDKAYQLFTLYRDKDGNIRQAPANGCHCKPLIRKLEGELRAAQQEMSTQILSVQEQFNGRLGKMDRRNQHQIKVLDILTQERVAAERVDLLYKMDQRASQNREDADRKQAAMSHELKKWCMTQMQDIDLHIPADPQYYKLLPSPSVDQSLTEGDLESLPLLSVVSEESSSSLATYVNLLPCPASCNAVDVGKEQATASRKYFEVKVDRSPDDYENTAIFPLPCSNHSSGLVVSSTDPCWPPAALQDSAVAAAAAMVGLSGEDWGSGRVSSSQSGGSDWEPWRQGHRSSYGSWHHRRRLLERFRAHRGGPVGGPGDGTRTLEFFIDRPPEPTFTQERNNLHAVEVTQCFFETVSTQMERWYERKILEAKHHTEVRAQRDREQLLRRISSLEEELQRLRTNGNTES